MFKPYAVHPASIVPGMTISVDLPHDRGLFITHKGRVHRITSHGNSRFMLTQEGAIIHAFDITDKAKQVWVTERDPEPSSLLELFDELA